MIVSARCVVPLADAAVALSANRPCAVAVLLLEFKLTTYTAGLAAPLGAEAEIRIFPCEMLIESSPPPCASFGRWNSTVFEVDGSMRKRWAFPSSLVVTMTLPVAGSAVRPSRCPATFHRAAGDPELVDRTRRRADDA